MKEINVKAYAKINISLDVLRKREDGFHEVEMIMQAVKLHDNIKITKTDKDIKITSNLYYLPVNENNLAYKAAKIFFDKSNLKFNDTGLIINLEKKIPVAAGLAGGSSDAAAVLKGLNKLFETGYTNEKLKEMAKQIGSDVPFCITGGTALATGRGENIELISEMPETIIVVSKPPIHVSTAEVYGNLDVNKIKTHPDTKKIIECIKEKNIVGISKNMYNVLELVTAREYNVINKIKNIMLGNGALGSIMSGSGPSVFGIFRDEAAAYKASRRLKTICSDIFITKTYN